MSPKDMKNISFNQHGWHTIGTYNEIKHKLIENRWETDLCIATFMSNISIVPVSTWNTYNILHTCNQWHNTQHVDNLSCRLNNYMSSVLFLYEGEASARPVASPVLRHWCSLVLHVIYSIRKSISHKFISVGPTSHPDWHHTRQYGVKVNNCMCNTINCSAVIQGGVCWVRTNPPQRQRNFFVAIVVGMGLNLVVFGLWGRKRTPSREWRLEIGHQIFWRKKSVA